MPFFKKSLSFFYTPRAKRKLWPPRNLLKQWRHQQNLNFEPKNVLIKDDIVMFLRFEFLEIFSLLMLSACEKMKLLSSIELDLFIFPVLLVLLYLLVLLGKAHSFSHNDITGCLSGVEYSKEAFCLVSDQKLSVPTILDLIRKCFIGGINLTP